MAPPTRAFVNDSDPMEVAAGSVQYAPAPNLPPPNPALGDRMRNRDWSGREQEMYYQMAQAPLPYQFSAQSPPNYGNFDSGNGNALTQWVPQGPPTGLQRAPVLYSDPRAPQARPSRPTYAYNRIVGNQSRVPTMYATWPAQYYPGGKNTYIPSWEATGLIVKYTRDQTKFRINKYLKDIKVPKDQGYYLTLSAQDPYRVVSINDYLWEDSADAPGGRQERHGFGFMPYRTARRCYPFNLGRKSVELAEWPILAEHAAMAACKAMTVRTIINTTLATTSGNWSGTGFTNTSGASGAWTTSSTSQNYVQIDINTAMIAIEQASGGIVTDEEALNITMNPTLARGVAKSGEYKTYIQGSPDALAAITDQRNPNRKYGLAPYLYGLALVVENAIRVSTPKPGNVPSPPADTKGYIWPTASVVISSKPTSITSEGEQTLDFSTFAARWYEQMTVESKSDPDNRREVGRVVEDVAYVLQAPQCGYLLTGNS